MWNHPSSTHSAPAQLSYDEMRELVGGLVAMQFFEEQGDPEQGRKVFAGKRCGACHDDAVHWRSGPLDCGREDDLL